MLKFKTNMKFINQATLYLLMFIIITLILSKAALAGFGEKSNEFYPGDAVQIYYVDIYKSSERGALNISGEYTIDSRGYIVLPLIGPVKVVGHNRYTLAEELAEKYKPFAEKPYIAITPLMRVAVMGPFYRPGAYRISPESSLWQLIEMAGGPRENIDLTSISVVRNDEVVIEDLLASFEKGYSLEDIGVKSGDQIVATVRRNFGLNQLFDYLRFGMSILSLYVLILRWESYNK